MYHLLPHYADIHCLVSINVKQASLNVVGYIFFFHMEEFCFLHTLISDTILPECCSAAICHIATKLVNCWQKGSVSIAVPPAFASDVVGHHNKIGRTFRATFVAHSIAFQI
jgi:hypothetical protein